MSSTGILVIDDDALNRELMEAFLSLGDYTAWMASSGAQGIKMAAEHQPGLIILDVKLADMTGYEVCSGLKSRGATRHIPILMISAFNESEVREQGEVAGADGFLSRPFTIDQLLDCIKAMLSVSNDAD